MQDNLQEILISVIQSAIVRDGESTSTLRQCGVTVATLPKSITTVIDLMDRFSVNPGSAPGVFDYANPDHKLWLAELRKTLGLPAGEVPFSKDKYKIRRYTKAVGDICDPHWRGCFPELYDRNLRSDLCVTLYPVNTAGLIKTLACIWRKDTLENSHGVPIDTIFENGTLEQIRAVVKLCISAGKQSLLTIETQTSWNRYEVPSLGLLLCLRNFFDSEIFAAVYNPTLKNIATGLNPAIVVPQTYTPLTAALYYGNEEMREWLLEHDPKLIEGLTLTPKRLCK